MPVFELTHARGAQDERRENHVRTWDDAVNRWRTESKHRASCTIEREERILKWLQPHLTGLLLAHVTRGRLADIRSSGLAAGWSNRTANYTVGVVSTVMRAANEWEWVSSVPRLRSLKLPPHRTRWLTYEEADRLLDELPQHLADMARFTLQTGLRKATLLAMHWDWLDWTQGRECVRVPAPKMKQRRPLIVPLSELALAIMRRLHSRRAGLRVWMLDGRQITEPNTRIWRQALQRAGIDDFTWHDLRHTWASWHVQSGTSLAVLKELGGWQTMQMVMVYAHLATRQLFDAVRDMRYQR